MARMTRIDKSAPHTEPLLRIYPGRCVLNERAARLLNISAGDRIDIVQNDEELTSGRDRIYICRTEAPRGYVVGGRGKTLRVNSAALSRSICEHLPGFGTYRICPEVTEIAEGIVYYNIFFRKYEKQ